MPRLSIDLNPREHQQLKTMAALEGRTIKDYVLSRVLADVPDPETMTDEQALRALKRLLAPRIAEAERGEVVSVTAEAVKREARARRKA